MQYRVLIVGTSTYNKNSPSRAFESYFFEWNTNKLAQIFSNPQIPSPGHCSTMYQITDYAMLRRWVNHTYDTGIIYERKELNNKVSSQLRYDIVNVFIKWLYKIGSFDTPFIYLLRGVLWKKNFWCTDKLNRWLDNFQPECVFLSFSDDFFIPQIALYVAKRYNVPIVSSIGDDYYFNDKKTMSPFYYIYKVLYRKLIDKVFEHKGSAIYIGNKIRDKYNSEFHLDGETVYLTSSMKRRAFKKIDKKNPNIIYCGNIRLGRNISLNEIGRALGEIDPCYKLNIYSNETDQNFYSLFKDNPNIQFNGAISYEEVQKLLIESDIVIVTEGFAAKDVEVTRYSLSTKVADSLSSGAIVLGYGPIDCGVIEYLHEIDCGVVCTSIEQLVPSIRNLLNNFDLQYDYYKKALIVSAKNHNIKLSAKIFEGVVGRVICK